MLLAAPRAEASCSPWKPRDFLTSAPGAFIGRFVARQGDRYAYAVDRAVKGAVGRVVSVRDEYPGVTSIGNLPAEPGREVALLLRRDATGGFFSNGCLVVPPAALRAAAASRRSVCLAPRVRRVFPFRARSGRGMRLEVTAEDRDSRLTSVRVAWGDGTTTVSRLRRSSARRRTVTVRHTYAKRGRRRIEVTAASSAIAIDCWIRGVVKVPERSEPARFAA